MSDNDTPSAEPASNKVSISATIDTRVGSNDIVTTPTPGPSDTRHVDVQQNPFGLGASVDATLGVPTSLGKLTLDGYAEHVIVPSKNLNYNNLEATATLTPKSGPIATVYGWYNPEIDHVKDTPSTTDASYGAYIETKPAALSKKDQVAFGAGFRDGSLYSSTREVFAEATHTLSDTKNLTAEAGHIFGPTSGNFIGVGYNDAKMQMALRQYFMQGGNPGVVGKNNSRLNASFNLQIDQKNALYARGTYDETAGKVQEITGGASHTSGRLTEFVEVGGIHSADDAPHSGLNVKGTVGVRVQFGQGK